MPSRVVMARKDKRTNVDWHNVQGCAAIVIKTPLRATRSCHLFFDPLQLRVRRTGCYLVSFQIPFHVAPGPHGREDILA